MMTQWAKAARRVQERTKAKAKERMVANKSEKDSKYGAKMAIMADLGGPTKLSGKAHKEVSLIPHSTNTDIPGTPRAREVQAGWARERICDSRRELVGRGRICSSWKSTGIHVIHVQREAL